MHLVSVAYNCFSPERISLTYGQMFISMRRRAELLTRPCRLKVTTEHEFQPCIWCPLHIKCLSLEFCVHISITHGRIFIKIWQYVCLREIMCRIYHTIMITAEGQIRVPSILVLLFPLECISRWSNVHLSELAHSTTV